MSYLTDENGKPLTKNGKMITAPPTGISNVTINGESVVKDGVAKIPLAEDGVLGVSKTRAIIYGIGINGNSELYINEANEINIKNRQQYRAITPYCIDNAVKVAMCDGKGEVWTAEEQLAARDRIGVEWKEVFNQLLEEDVSAIDIDLAGSYKEIRLFIQSKVANGTWGIINLFAKNKLTNIYTSVTLNTNYIANATNSMFDIIKLNDRDVAIKWYSNKDYFYNNLNSAQNTVCSFKYDVFDISKISISEINTALSVGTKIAIYAR